MSRAWVVVSLVALAVVVAGCAGPGKKVEKKGGTVEIKVPVAEKGPAVTPSPKPEVKPAPKPAPKPTPKPEVKPAPKPEVKPAPKPTPKPEVKPAPKPEEPKAELKELKAGLVAVDLTKQFNSDGMTDEANRSDADFDQWKQSFPAELLPKAGLFEPKDVPTAFEFPAKDAGKKNNVACAGQTILLAGKAKALHLLATATDGNQEEKVTVTYADGTLQADLKVTDWCVDAKFGEKEGAVSTHRVDVDANGQGVLSKVEKKCRLWVVAIPLDANRELKSVKLPYNSLVHIFALTLAK